MNAMRNPLLLSLIFAALVSTAASETSIIGNKDGKDIVTVRVGEASQSKQSLPIFPGISTKTAGAKGLSLLKVVIPPGGKAQAHTHKGHESAIYLLQGRVETRYGENLEKSVVNVAGDFIFIPPDVLHQPVNLSDSEAAIAIVARNDGDEQEHVILHPTKK
ncbi:cupin domain-containing protein [Methylocystis sp. MitZ-2018]|uniref:Cupin domain-containing protein n=2 Tax=Methylocystis rosea TaxID=173366 RepID=A0ABX6EGZ3_9HYPH|nr:cupin domain-containing protein [Methylocystis sp. MitZ-2018]QGM94031.1 cupin domain-containing protein [Methylocystis rosea]